MTTAEPRHLNLFNGLTEFLGEDRADTLMTHLPSQESTDLGTKAGLDALKVRLVDRLDTMGHRLEAITHRLDRMVFALVAGLIAIIATLVPSRSSDRIGKLDRCHSPTAPRHPLTGFSLWASKSTS